MLPLSNVGVEQRAGASYGKKIGFNDDFDDDWDQSEGESSELAKRAPNKHSGFGGFFNL